MALSTDRRLCLDAASSQSFRPYDPAMEQHVLMFPPYVKQCVHLQRCLVYADRE
jgi:hypothetical protein